MRRGYADTEVGQVHYVEAGEGPPVVLLHQTASSSVVYARTLPLLAVDDDEEREEWPARDDLKSGWVPDGKGEFPERDILDYVAHFATENDDAVMSFVDRIEGE